MPTTQTHQLRLTRTFNASPQEVYSAWTDPEAIKVFFMPRDGFVISRVEMDVRVGGRYTIAMRGPDGTVHTAAGVFKEVLPGKKLVYTWTRMDGESCSGGSTSLGETLITMDFSAKGKGTELIFVQDLFPDTASRDAHENGWTSILDHLKRFRA